MESAVRAPQPARAIDAPRVRRPLFDDVRAARALDRAQHIFTASLPLLAADRSAPESIGRYGGAALVAESLARAGGGDDATVRAVLREALVFAPDRLSLYDGAAGLLVVLDALDPQRASLAGVRARLHDAVDASVIGAPPGDPTDMLSFDLISGVAGRAIALGADASAEARGALRAFAHAFADTVEARLASDDENVAAVNLGLAHGVPGMLAALNAALPDDRAPAALRRAAPETFARRRRRAPLGLGVACRGTVVGAAGVVLSDRRRRRGARRPRAARRRRRAARARGERTRRRARRSRARTGPVGRRAVPRPRRRRDDRVALRRRGHALRTSRGAARARRPRPLRRARAARLPQLQPARRARGRPGRLSRCGAGRRAVSHRRRDGARAALAPAVRAVARLNRLARERSVSCHQSFASTTSTFAKNPPATRAAHRSSAAAASPRRAPRPRTVRTSAAPAIPDWSRPRCRPNLASTISTCAKSPRAIPTARRSSAAAASPSSAPARSAGRGRAAPVRRRSADTLHATRRRSCPPNFVSTTSTCARNRHATRNCNPCSASRFRRTAATARGRAPTRAVRLPGTHATDRLAVRG